jgi:hypothetical protein
MRQREGHEDRGGEQVEPVGIQEPLGSTRAGRDEEAANEQADLK